MRARRNYQVYLSNQLERLADCLRESFRKRPPFEKKVILVPSAQIKSFLLFHFVDKKKEGVATGMHFYSFSQFFRFLLERTGKGQRLPTFQELTTSIEYELLKALSTTELPPEFLPVAEYVSGRPKERERRLYQISHKLASLFLEYATFGGEFFNRWLTEWGWQQTLWKTLFDSRWTTPLMICRKCEQLPFPIDLFGFSFIPPLFQHFFKNQKSFFYALSPSPLFWADLCTPKERMRLQKSGENRGVALAERQTFADLIEDQNRLLAHNSRLGRHLFPLLEDEGADLHECYDQGADSKKTLLDEIKTDLCHLSKRETYEIDDSIQIHAAPSKKREVDVLLNNVLEKLEQGIRPKEIIVLAPEIEGYAPFIETAFNSAPLPLSVVIEEGESGKDDSLILALLHLLSLKEGRFEREEALKLFSFASFRKRLNFSESEGKKFCQWLRSASILWGYDAEARQEIVGQRVALGTFEFGFDRLLWGLAMQESEDDRIDLPLAPLNSVENYEAETLGVGIEAIKKVHTYFAHLKRRPKRSWSEWLKLLNEIKSDFFVVSIQEEQEFFECFKELQVDRPLPDPLFGFDAFFLALKTAFKKRGRSSPQYNREAIRCLNLKMDSVPSGKVLFVLGVEEEKFPRRVQRNPFCNPAFSKEGDVRPQGVDEDRALFLSLFLLAKEALIFSFVSRNAQDGKEQAPSVLLDELLAFLGDKRKGHIIHHPVRPFDPKYFEPQSRLKNYSEQNFLEAKATLDEKREPPSPFFIQKQGTSIDSQDLVIPLRDLKLLARHPIQFYLNKALRLYLPREGAEHEEFLLSPKTKGLLRKQSLKTPLERLLKQASQMGKLPLWTFSKIAEEKVKTEVGDYHRTLDELGIDRGSLFSVELHPEVKRPIWHSNSLLRHPAVEVPLENGKRAWITGALSDLTAQGLLFHGKEGVEDRLKGWPELLVLGALSIEEVKEKALLFTKHGKTVPVPEGDLTALLRKYVGYYQRSLKEVSPLMPKWAEPLLQEDEKGFEKRVAASLVQSDQFFEDPYLKWALDKGFDARFAFGSWAKELKEVFHGIV